MAEEVKPVQSFAFGGGVQSNAILVAIAQGKLSPPDVCIIADTGYETRGTWEYLEKHGKPLMDRLGIPLMRVCRAETTLEKKYCKPVVRTNGGDNLTYRIPIFVLGPDGDIGKMRTYCSGDWKRDTVRWHLRERFGQRRRFVEWIGFSTDEIHRARRQKVSLHDGEKWRQRYPLIELKIDRFNAIKMVRDYGFPTPPRSSCWMCPNKSNAEWRHLRDNFPDEFAKAQKLEKQIQDFDKMDGYTPFLTRTGKNLAEAPIDDDAQGEFGFCDSGHCFT